MSRDVFTKLNYSRALRRPQTESESILWTIPLEEPFKAAKFRRPHVIGQYIADFCSLSMRRVIEIDGEQHKARKQEHQVRTRYLEKEGFRVIRFWDGRVVKDTAEVVALINRALTLPLSHVPRARALGRLPL